MRRREGVGSLGRRKAKALSRGLPGWGADLIPRAQLDERLAMSGFGAEGQLGRRTRPD